jgi:hypothetical protein
MPIVATFVSKRETFMGKNKLLFSINEIMGKNLDIFYNSVKTHCKTLSILDCTNITKSDQF